MMRCVTSRRGPTARRLRTTALLFIVVHGRRPHLCERHALITPRVLRPHLRIFPFLNRYFFGKTITTFFFPPSKIFSHY